jgi:hypothetical protein
VKKLALLVVLVLATCVTASAQPQWLAWFGLDNNSYPGGLADRWNLFGAFCEDTDDFYAGLDVVNPPPAAHQVEVIFRGDQYGNNPTYPSDGLSWDIRAPYIGCKVWKLDALLPDAGYTCDILFDCEAFEGYGLGLPAGWICRLDTDGEINADNYLDLDLYEYDLDHSSVPGDNELAAIATIAQTGQTETWYIIAGVPEPPVIQLTGLLLGVLGIGFARFRT